MSVAASTPGRPASHRDPTMQPSSLRAPVEWARALTPSAMLRAGALALVLSAQRPLHAQRVVDSPTRRDPWTLDGQYLQLGGRALGRDATPSMSVTLGREVAEHVHGMSWRGEAGFMRAVAAPFTAQGGTLGLSASVAVPHTGQHEDGGPRARLLLRPGVSMLAGWAESQDSSAMYEWRGVAGTPATGTSGTQYTWSTTRGGTVGVGISLGAELRVSRALALSASVQRWGFSGSVAGARRRTTLVGVGVSARPLALAHDARQLWHSFGARHESARDDARNDSGVASAGENVP
jgi:hypothetical protein